MDVLRNSIQIRSTGYPGTHRIYRVSEPWADGTTIAIAKRVAPREWRALRANGVRLTKDKFTSPGEVLEWARKNKL